MADPVLVEVTRGGIVESRHRGAVAVVDASGGVVAAIGDIDQVVFPRSTVKAIQALPLVESGAADRYGFGPAELALACSSHNGEPRHVATAQKMLAAAGRSAADLECGPQVPSSESAAAALFRAGERPGPIHNNCSGKHAGFICFACHEGIDPRGYVRPDHPVQRSVTAALADVTGTALDERNRGIDGCSIPTYAIPLKNLARGFARFVTGEGLAEKRAAAARRLVAASAAEPWMIGGTGRFVTEVLEKLGGTVFAKDGAEGTFCAAFREVGLGMAVKCDDGAGRAADVILGAVIEAFVAPGAELSRRPVKSRRGEVVGEVRAVHNLKEMLTK
ncbi:MAG: asparaginase [Rhizobiales bacterium]|nr:asparaginase [Hyphomicrobiales bacterium]